MTFPRSVAACGLALVLMVVGSFGPWAKILGTVTISGTDNGKDGWVVLGAAIGAAVFLLIAVLTRMGWFALGGLIAGVIAGGTTVYDVRDINGVGDGSVASAEWGIYIAMAGSFALILCSIWAIVEVRKPVPADAPPAPAPPTS